MNPLSLGIIIIIKLNFCICHMKDGTLLLHIHLQARMFLTKTEFSVIIQAGIPKVANGIVISSLHADSAGRKYLSRFSEIVKFEKVIVLHL